jgi:RNA 2',3'-cyclic 3'-phosphodiesterase
MRLFLAVFPPTEVQQAVWHAAAPLRAGRAPVSWTKADNLHYTLRFLGELGEDGARRAGEATLEAAAPHAPFELALAGFGAFPDARRARVLWVGAAEGRDPLESLAGSLDRALGSRGFGRADRPFKAHLTIGRPRVPGGDWTAALAGMDSAEIARFGVARLVLVQSQLSPKGSIYTPLVQAKLGG